jgi:hypothetical protein
MSTPFNQEAPTLVMKPAEVNGNHRFRRFMENACLLGGMILIWLTLIGIVGTAIWAATYDSGSSTSFDNTTTTAMHTDSLGYVCESWQTDLHGRCPDNVNFGAK